MASSNGLSPQSQCLLRQKDLFENGRWLLVNPTDALVFSVAMGLVTLPACELLRVWPLQIHLQRSTLASHHPARF